MKKWLIIVPGLTILIFGSAMLTSYRNGGINQRSPGQAAATVAAVSPTSQSEPEFDAEEIAGKSPEEVASVLGEPTRTEQVNPSSTPCPCDKLFYKGGELEIVYINGIADWITINLPPHMVRSDGQFLSIDQFSDYTYVKFKTK